MKKVLIIGLGFFAFACGDSGNTTTEAETNNADESVEIGAGEEISPQLEYDEDSARLDVDTTSTSGQVQ